MSREDDARGEVAEVLESIESHRYRDLKIPHGFRVLGLDGSLVPGFIEETEGVEVKLRIEVPVLYSLRNGRAELPAQRDNIESLRAWIDCALHERASRLRIVEWRVSPDEASEPARDSTAPTEQWTVDVVFRGP